MISVRIIEHHDCFPIIMALGVIAYGAPCLFISFLLFVIVPLGISLPAFKPTVHLISWSVFYWRFLGFIASMFDGSCLFTGLIGLNLPYSVIGMIIW